jgi:predicted nucleotidyltransferase
VSSTHILDAAIRRRRERLERERRAVLEDVIRALLSAGALLGIEEAYVVGSVASEGEWTDGSDVDVAIAGGDPLAVMRILEEATGRAVDVVDLTAHPAPSLFRRRGIKVLG